MAVREARVAGIDALVAPRLLLRRARLRGVACPATAASRCGRALWAAGEPHGVDAVRHRDDARAARGEGLRDRRPGDRRHGDAARPRPGLARVEHARRFVGRRSLRRPDATRPGRKQLVALLPTTARPARGGRAAHGRRRRASRRCRCSATSRRATAAPRSAARSRWRCWATAASATARPSTSTTWAACTRRRSSTPCSTTAKGARRDGD